MNQPSVQMYSPSLGEERFEALKTLLSFQSISTDPAYAQSCRDCASWLSAYLETIGLHSELLETGRQPVVFATKEIPGAPRLLFYGHYDVQPIDPLDAWETDPFKAELKGERLYARGAQDNKGQLFYFLCALEDVLKQQSLAYSITIILEGEEECGSVGISQSLPAWKEKLRADVLLVCDTGTRSQDVETITVGLRGITGYAFEIQGASNDLHSGVHGGVAPNPAVAVAKVISSLYDSRGAVAVKGFYDGLMEPSASELKGASSFMLPDELYEQMTGVRPRGGEIGLSFGERRGLRPTLEVVGLYSGYTGAGIKTIIPAKAGVKLSARLVCGQDPESVSEAIEAHVRSQVPDFFKIIHSAREEGGPALRVSPDSNAVQGAVSVFESLGLGKPEFLWEGASIPFLSDLVNISGASPLLVGFGLEADQIHAPNESFSLRQFEKGYRFCQLFLQKA